MKRLMLGAGMILPFLLGATPDLQEKPVEGPRTDLLGDALPPGAIQRIGTVRFQHSGKSHHGIALTALGVSPDGRRIASAAGDGTIRIWDFQTAKELVRWTAHAGEISAVEFSPDGRLLASAGGAQMVVSRMLPDSDKRVRIWDAATGKEMLAMAGHERGVTCLAFSPAGNTIVSGSMDRSFRLWDLKTGAELMKFTGHKAPVSTVSFSGDGSKLATTARDGFLIVWDMSLLTELRRIPLRKAVMWPGVSDIKGAFSSDAKLLASVDGDLITRKIRLWEADSGKELGSITPNPEHEYISGAAFTPDGKSIVSRGGGGKLHLWDVASGKQILDFRGFELDLMACAVTPDGKTLVAGGDDGGIRLWNLGDGQPAAQTPPAQGELHSVAFSPDGRHVATASLDTTVRLWDPVTGMQVLRLQAPGTHNLQKAVVFSPDGKLLAAVGSADHILFWDPRTGKEMFRVVSSAECLAFSPDGKSLALGGSAGLHLFELGGDAPRRVTDSPANVRSVAYSPDGKTISAVGFRSDGGSTLFLAEASSGRTLLEWDANEKFTYALAYSPDGSILATTGEGGVRLWEVATARPSARLIGADGGGDCVAFSSDGKLLATGGKDRSVRLWEVSTGSQLCRFQGHDSEVKSVAFSPEGGLLASASRDGTALIWDVARGPRPAAPDAFRESEAQSLWDDLSQPDAVRAARAMAALASGGSRALAYLRGQFAQSPADPALTRRLLAELDHDDLSVRARASTELERLGDEISIRQALARHPSAEMKNRLEGIQAVWRRPVIPSPHLLRMGRAVLVLERIASDDSHKLLEELAYRPTEILRRDVQAALERLDRRAAGR